MRAIIGHFTIQNIQQKIDHGDRVIKLEYGFIDVPDDVFNVLVGYTSKPVVKDENNADESELLDQLHDSVSIQLTDWIKSDIYVGSGGEVHETELKEGQIGFYFEKAEELV